MGLSQSDAPKQPWEEITDYIEFSGRLAPGDTIASAVLEGWSLGTGTGGADESDDTIFDATPTLAGTRVYFVYKAGVNATQYKISIRATSVAGVKLEEDFIFSVEEL